MNTPLNKKSSVKEIKDRFDQDVERFSNLDKGQEATIDAPLAMELITQAAYRSTSPINKVLDIGCGAGNNSIKLAELTPHFDCDLVDLSLPMLKKAHQRISKKINGKASVFQGDIRHLDLGKKQYNIILAAAVLHHLRDDQDWESTFLKIFHLLAPGGSFWITDLVCHETFPVQELMKKQYEKYLLSIGDEGFKNKVFEYIEKEDSPRPVTYQLELLKRVGFEKVELLHKNSCFAAFGGIKSSR